MSFRLVVDDSNWLLLTGGRYSEVVVWTGLTVLETVKTQGGQAEKLVN